VIRGLEKLMEEYPHVAFYREAAAAYLGRGELLLLLGRPGAAAAELTKSLAVSRELLDKFGVLSASMLVRGQTFLALGRARAAAGKPGEAAEEWTKAAKVFELALKVDPENFHHRRGFAEAGRALKPAAK
jgi:tetratricopeptide (TPR) repeat protein